MLAAGVLAASAVSASAATSASFSAGVLSVNGDGLDNTIQRSGREDPSSSSSTRDAEKLLLATGEVLANAHRYGGGARTLKIGRVGGPLRLRDLRPRARAGRSAGRLQAPGLEPRRGAGLWVARQVTRRLDMISTERGLTTRLWI